MIISRTPFRISLMGGGTDLRAFYRDSPGKTLTTTINKFIYVTVKRQLDIVEHRYRISWSQIEFKNSLDEIEHPIVRETLRLLEIDFPLEITTFSDIPASTGLGSSSAFAVGLLHALYALKRQLVSKASLASQAAKIEVDILGRNMGKQDHYASAYGGFNVFTFLANETVINEPVFYNENIRIKLEKNLMLFYTGTTRNASDILKIQIEQTEKKRQNLVRLRDMVIPLQEALMNEGNPDIVGEFLHESWKLKRDLTDQVSNSSIDAFYEKARKAGAIGGKLLGAGGGGFLLLYVQKEKQKRVIQELSDLYHMPFSFDSIGTRITYYD